MGRPRKEEPVMTEADEKQPGPPLDYKSLKECPSCHNGKPEAPIQDRHKLYRCSCPTCGFWDCMAYLTPELAAKGWQAAGGANPE